MAETTAQQKQLSLSSRVKTVRTSKSYTEEFEIPYRPNMNVISALDGNSA